MQFTTKKKSQKLMKKKQKDIKNLKEDFKKEIFKLEKQITLPKRKVLDLERKRF